MRRWWWSCAALAIVPAALSGTVILAEMQDAHGSMPHQMPAKPKMMTTAQKIANAMSAAPSSISAKATILDWPADEKSEPMMLRQGSNGWSCLPDMADTEGNDPVCIDAPWMKWVQAYMSKTTPDVGRVGIGYMLAPGGAWGSNTDPFAMKMMADNHWGHHEPHLMIVVPDVKTLAGMSTDAKNGGPYVMYPGTPYAHIMAPIPSGTIPMK
jgi:hypothetical protein